MSNRKPQENGTKKSLPTKRITPRALLEAKNISSLRIHPDGCRVVFSLREADFHASRWKKHLWVAEYYPPEDSEETDSEQSEKQDEEEEDNSRQLTYSYEGEAFPRWSPDGQHLAFLSTREDPTRSEDDDEDYHYQIWTLPEDGGEAHRLTNAKEDVEQFEWIPDSDRIVYFTLEPRPSPVQSVRKEREGQKIDPIVEHEERRRCQFWSIGVYEKKPTLVFTTSSGTNEFAISPDGKKIAYTTNYTGEDNDYHIADLYLYDIESKKSWKLASRGGDKNRLRWSPDGKRLAFISWYDPNLSYSRESLFAVDIPHTLEDLPLTDFRQETAGICEAYLLTDLDYDIDEYEWMPGQEGSLLAIAICGTSTRLYKIVNRQAIVVKDVGAVRSWLTVHPEREIYAFVYEDSNSLPEIMLHLETGELKLITLLNEEFPQNYRIAQQEVVRWQSGDGLEIEGVLTYPLDFYPNQRYPMILQLHGGPKGNASTLLTDYYMAQVWAGEGYIVLNPNFRGSEGYGNAFAIANRRDIGVGDLADILSGLDWCVGQGFVDEARIGVMGGSYGGFLTNRAISASHRFKAAISMFGIFHLQTDFSNSSIPRWEYEYLGAYYWEDPEIYQRLSPGSYVKQIATPTLILHGDEDDTTSPANSRELYQALRRRGVETQFVHYPREGHGLREPNHRLDEIRRCLVWMDRFLGSGHQSNRFARIGDKVASSDGIWELMVSSAETSTFMGHTVDRKPTDSGDSTRSQQPEYQFLEVNFTIHRIEPNNTAPALRFILTDMVLELSNNQHLKPIGVPSGVAGGKILVEGNPLSISVEPNKETGEQAFGIAAVFKVPTVAAEASLTLPNFAGVALHWQSSDAPEDDSED